MYVLFRDELLSFNCHFHIDGTLGDSTGSLPCLSFYLPTYPAGSLSLSSKVEQMHLLRSQTKAACVWQQVTGFMKVLADRFHFMYLCFGVCACIHECDTLLLAWDTLNVVICIPSSILIQLLYSVLLHLF